MTIEQMISLIYRTRDKHFADTEGLVRSYPLNSCGGSDERYFLRNFMQVDIDGKSDHEILITWAHPDLSYECKNPDSHFFVDATFKCVPKGFSQCLIVMYYSYPADMYIPVYYVLMQSKRKDAYIWALQNIISISDWNIFAKSVTCDFEQGLIAGVHHNFKEAQIIGCSFHWKQALRRRLIDFGIDKEVISTLMDENGLINLLSVVPPEELWTKTIPYIRSKFPEAPYQAQFTRFWNYFKSTWIDGKIYDVEVNSKLYTILFNFHNKIYFLFDYLY
jgi:hypothetical protein